MIRLARLARRRQPARGTLEHPPHDPSARGDHRHRRIAADPPRGRPRAAGGQLPRHRRPRGAGAGHAHPEGQCLWPRPGRGGAQAGEHWRPHRGRGLPGRRPAPAPPGREPAGAGAGRHRGLADPALSGARPDPDRVVGRQAARHRRVRGSGWQDRAGASEDRHRHGAAGRALVQRRTLLEESLRCRHVRHRRASSPTLPTPTGPTSATRGCSWNAFTRCWHSTSGARLPTPLRHAANSGAILQLPESHLDLVRPGILFYGARPSPEVPAQRPGGLCAALGHAGGVLQGGQARSPHQLRLHLHRPTG